MRFRLGAQHSAPDGASVERYMASDYFRVRPFIDGRSTPRHVAPRPSCRFFEDLMHQLHRYTECRATQVPCPQFEGVLAKLLNSFCYIITVRKVGGYCHSLFTTLRSCQGWAGVCHPKPAGPRVCMLRMFIHREWLERQMRT